MDSITPFKIRVCGIDELVGHCDAGVSHVLSILDPDWPVPEAFGAFGEHAKLEFRFHDVIEEHNAEMIAPQQEHVADLLAFGRGLLEAPQSEAYSLVHCHAGVSRSTASLALILAQALPTFRARASLTRCCTSVRKRGRTCEFLNSALRNWPHAATLLVPRQRPTVANSRGSLIWPSRCGRADAAGRST